MKYFSIFKILIFILIVQSCNTTKNTSIYWISGQKTECSAGVGKMKCLKIHKGEDLNNPKWENFYANIEGFTFEEGQLQKIEVEEEELDPKNVPADASSIKYTLVKVLEKQQDYQSLLDGTWTPSKINGNPINRKAPLPKLSINLSEKRVSGTDGCNNYSTEVINVDAPNIKLGNIIGTQKMCMDMSVATAYNKALRNIATYKIKAENLHFYNAEGNEVLSFIKNSKSEAHQNLHDIWNVTHINGAVVDKMDSRPSLEINLTEMKIRGNNGCNGYFGEITDASAKSLSFGNIAATKRMCPKMETPNNFDAALSKVHSYEINELKLVLRDKEGKEVLAFLKGD